MDKGDRKLHVSKAHKEEKSFLNRRNELFRRLPKIDRIMGMELTKELTEQYGYRAVLEAARKVEEQLRDAMRQQILAEEKPAVFLDTSGLSGQKDGLPVKLSDLKALSRITLDYTEYILQEMKSLLAHRSQRQMQRVINATGVILHTNLGRAPLGDRLVSELVPLMTGYTNLELNLEDGKRGNRYEHFAENLCKLTGAEAAIAVNNNAAAVLLMLTALASGGETVVSRGELVEIGGKFRIPDVCSQSGTTLVEVGTTNRTYLEDYENAVTENTAVFLKVHTSNYQITGFTREAELTELAEAAHNRGIPLLVDFGSGSLVDIAFYGIEPEKTVSIYLDEGQLEKEIPVYDMMSRSAEELKRNALWLMGELLADASEYEFAVTSTRNPVGGGTTPGKTLPGAALQIRSLNGKGLSAQEISDCLRKMDTPVIGHIVDDWVYLEMRTIRTGEELEILRKELKYDLYKKNPQ